MRWIFKTYSPGVYAPSIFECEAEDIVQADILYEAATGIDPCKPPKGKGLAVLRFCPELPCNKGIKQAFPGA